MPKRRFASRNPTNNFSYEKAFKISMGVVSLYRRLRHVSKMQKKYKTINHYTHVDYSNYSLFIKNLIKLFQKLVVVKIFAAISNKDKRSPNTVKFMQNMENKVTKAMLINVQIDAFLRPNPFHN